MRRALFCVGVLILSLFHVLGSDVTLAWDASPDPRVVDYNVYYGQASHCYTNKVLAGDNTSLTVTGLSPGITYYFSATAMDSNGLESAYCPEVTNQVTCEISLSNLIQVYNGQPETASFSTIPSNLPVVVTYNGSPVRPVNAGSYTVAALAEGTNCTGGATNTFTILPAPAAIILSGMAQRYTGNPCPVSTATVPAGLPVAVAYSGAAQPPSAAGTYAVLATVGDTNYAGSTNAMLRIKDAPSSIQLIIVSWNCSLTNVIVQQSTNLVDWNVVASDPGDPSAVTVTNEPGSFFFRATANGAGIPLSIQLF